MTENKVHFRHILLYHFRQGKKAVDARREICAVYGVEAVNERTCHKWYSRFRSGNFNIEDAQRCGRPHKADDNGILEMIQNDPHLTTQEIAEKFSIDRSTVGDRLKKLGMVKKGDVWILRE